MLDGSKNNPTAMSFRTLAFLILYAALGFIGNYCKLELFFNVDFLFGGLFTILAVTHLGRPAIISAFIASLYTYALWNHPYAVVIFTAEAAFIAYFRKKAEDVILLDILYWLTCGFPIVFVTYHLVMHMPTETTLLVAMKQGVNGIFNAIMASIVFHSYNYYCKSMGKPHRKVSLKHIFFKILVMSTSLPILFYVIFSVRHHTNDLTATYTARTSNMFETAKLSVSAYLEDAVTKIDGLENHIENDITLYGHIENESMDSHLRYLLMSDSTFSEVSVLNPRLTAVNMLVKKNGNITDKSGADLSFGNYFSDAAGTGKVFFTDLHQTDEDENTKTVSAVKCIKNSSGEIIAYVRSGIDFTHMVHYLGTLSGNSGVYFTLMDRHNRIILTTNPEYSGMKKYTDRRTNGVLSVTQNEVMLWQPKLENNISVMTAWKNSYYIESDQISPLVQYRLAAETPLSGFVENANNTGFYALLIIFVMIVLSVVSALIFSRKTAHHFAHLAESTKHLPDSIACGEELRPEPSIFSEVSSLTDNFHSMAEKLSESFRSLKQQSEKLNLVLNSIPLIIFVKDTKNNVIMGNKTAADAFGFSLESLMNIPVSVLFPDSYEKYYNDDIEVIKSGQPVKKIVQTYQLKNGTRTVITDKIPLINESGHTESILVISTDITDEIKMQEEKSKTLEMLYQQSKMAEMGAMIGAITHQWKQPLNSISLLAQVILSDLEDKTLENSVLETNLSLIQDNVSFMSQTVQDFSNFYKPNKEKQVFKACETVQEIYALLDKQFIKSNIAVVFQPHEHFEVYGLRNEFKQVCLNLLNNAKEAILSTGRKDGRIEIKYHKTPTHGHIIISDNGGGIAPELLPEKLFEINQTTKTSGTGIGLFICKTIVNDHMHGNISAKNTDEGAEFSITLPLNSNIIA